MMMLIMSPVLVNLVHCDDVSSNNGDDGGDNEDNNGKGIYDSLWLVAVSWYSVNMMVIMFW